MIRNRRSDFLTWSGGFLLTLLCLSLGLASWAGIPPLSTIHWSMRDFGIGSLAAVGMILVFGFVTPVRNEAETILGPALASCFWYDLLILAALVGFIEELLFRGVLEPWVARVDPILAFCSVNLLFGLLHAVSIPYAVVATLLGAVLSLLAHWPGEFNLLRPIVAHSIYDFIGFFWIAQEYRSSVSQPTKEHQDLIDDDPDMLEP